MFPETLLARATALVSACTAKGLIVTTAESCTGGLVAGLLTEIAGSSAVLDRGVVTYSNTAKRELLGVSEAILTTAGAVSPACARAMAEGALARSGAGVAVSITGIAGPGGGSADKPVGLVHFALARAGTDTLHVERRFGQLGRSGIRLAAVTQALAMLEAAAAAA